MISVSADGSRLWCSRSSACCSRYGHLPRFRSDDADTHRKDCFELFCSVETASQHLAVCVRSGLADTCRGIVLTKLDYGSTTLAGLPAVQLDRLQSVLSAAAWLIYQRRKFDNVSPLLKELHWLRVPEHITFQLAVLAYRCQRNMALHYLTIHLHQASNVGYRQRLCSSSSAMLDVPRTEQVTIGGRAFSSTAAHVWNSLPTAMQSSKSLDIFWRHLKTELFEHSNNWHRACQTTLLLRDSHFSCSFLLWPQPWSLLTIMLLWHTFLIIVIIMIMVNNVAEQCESAYYYLRQRKR